MRETEIRKTYQEEDDEGNGEDNESGGEESAICGGHVE